MSGAVELKVNEVNHNHNDSNGDTNNTSSKLHGPRSVQQKAKKEPSEMWKRIRVHISQFYDILTILISIADITTDIVVLVSFYNHGRMAFFGISLTILILAQCAYAMAFSARYETLRNYDECQAILIWCCVLPFATIVAFCFYFTDDQDSCCSRSFRALDLVTDNTLSSNTNQSRVRQFTSKKLSKHMGFVMEAVIEAFPQSLLQMTAIVIYQETDYISIASIFLSMLSVCSKSLIFSQGINFKVFLWTWICIVADFFGIFFAISWVFFRPDPNLLLQMPGRDFFAAFHLIGEIWIWKTMLSSAPVVVFGLLGWFGCGVWYLLVKEVFECNRNCVVGRTSTGDILFELFLLLILVNIAVIIGAFGAFLACEVFCCSFFALSVWYFTTYRWRNWESKTHALFLSDIQRFVSSAHSSKNDRTVRILAVNYGLQSSYSKMHNYIVQKQSEGYEALRRVSYKDIRQHSHDISRANIIPFVAENWFYLTKKWYDLCTGSMVDVRNIHVRNDCRVLCKPITYTLLFLGSAFLEVVFAPVVLVCKVCQLLFPYMVIGVLSYFHLWTAIYEEHSFQFAMLLIYVAMQALIVVLFLCFIRDQFWLWHVLPGYTKVPTKSPMSMQTIYSFYDDTVWLPQIEEYILARFGKDISGVIIYYLQNMDLSRGR